MAKASEVSCFRRPHRSASISSFWSAASSWSIRRAAKDRRTACPSSSNALLASGRFISRPHSASCSYNGARPTRRFLASSTASSSFRWPDRTFPLSLGRLWTLGGRWTMKCISMLYSARASYSAGTAGLHSSPGSSRRSSSSRIWWARWR